MQGLRQLSANRSRTTVQVAPVRQVPFHVETTRERVVIPSSPRDQPAPRTIEEFQRDRIRATVEAVLRRLNGIAGDLAEQRDLGAINEAMSDEKNGISRATALKLLLSSGRPWTRTR